MAGSTTVAQPRAQPTRWRKPPRGTLKLNCDGSFLPTTSSGSWGFLIRDSDGEAVITGRGGIKHMLNPFHAEIIVCLQAV